MTKLLYRGNDYFQQKNPISNKECFELTYRREHYNSCRDAARREQAHSMTYRGAVYIK